MEDFSDVAHFEHNGRMLGKSSCQMFSRIHTGFRCVNSKLNVNTQLVFQYLTGTADSLWQSSALSRFTIG